MEGIHEENDGTSDDNKWHKVWILNRAIDQLKKVLENETGGRFPIITERLNLLIDCSHQYSH